MSIGAASRKAVCDILLVEDSPTQAEWLRYSLEGHGHRVRVAGNGLLALDLVRERAPAVVASNVVAAGMDGYALCRALKADPFTREIRVILLTALSDPKEVFRGLDCGADDILCKPFDESVLPSRVEYFLQNEGVRRRRAPGEDIEIVLEGERTRVSASPTQMFDLLLSAFDTIVRKNKELERVHRELKRAHVVTQAGGDLLRICAKCKKIQNERGDWISVEEFFRAWAGLSFSHEFCRACSDGLARPPGRCEQDGQVRR